MNRLGATGEFPDGKLTSGDEGELQLAVGDLEGKVMILFGKPVAWIGLPPQDARQFAEMILNRCTLVECQENEKERERERGQERAAPQSHGGAEEHHQQVTAGPRGGPLPGLAQRVPEDELDPEGRDGVLRPDGTGKGDGGEGLK